MAKDWFRLGRTRRRNTAGPQLAQQIPVDAAAEPTTAEASAEPVVEARPESTASAPEAAEVAPTSAATDDATSETVSETASETASEAVTEREETTPTQPQVARARLTGTLLPTYVDRHSAGNWLAALSEVTSVTAYKALSYDLLNLKPGDQVADIGCGIGQDARLLSLRVAPGGSVVGIDSNEAMIAQAIATGETPGLRFQIGDAAALPLDDMSCDAVRADRMLQHVENPLQALLEMRRVLRPGGRLVIVEPDWKTMAVYPGSGAGGDDDTCVDAIFDWQVANTPHALIGRQLRSLLTQAGFASVNVSPVAYASTRFAEADLVLELTRAAEAATRLWPNRLSPNKAQAWRTTAKAADAAGHFFASVPLFFAHATVE